MKCFLPDDTPHTNIHQLVNTHLCSHLCWDNLTFADCSSQHFGKILFFLFALSRLPKAFYAAVSESCVCVRVDKSNFYSAVLCLTREPCETRSHLPVVSMFSAPPTFQMQSVLLFVVTCVVRLRCAEKVQLRSFADVFFSVDLLALQCLREPSFPHSR